MSRGLSQETVAQRMRERGHSFQQQTILKIEKGDRPLRLAEAVQLVDVLGVEIRELFDEWDFALLAAGRRLDSAISQLAVQIHGLEELHQDLRRAVAHVDESQVPAWILELLVMTPGQMIDLAVRRADGEAPPRLGMPIDQPVDLWPVEDES